MDTMLLPQRWTIFVAYALTWSTMSTCSVYGLFHLQGHEKDAWPELLHATLEDALLNLKKDGLVENVFVQPPSSGVPPPNPGSTSDVWLYVDGDGGAVYEIPKRGTWHPNRLNPGWPELVGKDYKAAISKITEDYLGVTVIYGPKGFMRIQDFRLDRVWLDVNPNGTVAGVPSIG
ncbi:hypothetical protein M758_11G053500 [Ceratodon purpureus]|uniref:Uncharacterized protein n=1 Tax=Ceratodon purpureus TaxID=3225 RepID=A0A8T0GD57_CERPU|nr:hypothetical protein KC19_11G055100 [Ceratodon purpureus]KAG0600687.1 hypothetical protein M758_11G053500 [Ceratodon purpureus]